MLAPVRSNLAMDYAFYDEGAFRNVNRNADMRVAPEALRLVNSALAQSQAVTEVEIGKAYGEARDRTLRIVHNTPNIHPLLPYDATSVAHLLDFFTSVFELAPSVPSSRQTWWYKELCTLIALVGALLFLVPCATLLLRLPPFAALVRPARRGCHAPAPAGGSCSGSSSCSRRVWPASCSCRWSAATAVLFPAASSSQQTWWFPQRINNAILLWAVVNGAIGLAVSGLTYRFHGRRNGVTSEMLGLRASRHELASTLGLALCGPRGLLRPPLRLLRGSSTPTSGSCSSRPRRSFPSRHGARRARVHPCFFVFYLANSIRVRFADASRGSGSGWACSSWGSATRWAWR